MSEQQPHNLDAALTALLAGEPVLVHDSDDREGETDLVYAAGAITPGDITRLRNDAGGLICVALSDDIAEAIDLPFLVDELDHPAASEGPLGYGDRSAFSLTVNHRDTYTGITDEDRALTVSELANVATTVQGGVEYGPEAFATEFRTPGHVHILRGAPGGLTERQGHTELGLALAVEAGLPPAVVVCEMLDDETGRAAAPAAAKEYGRRHGVPFVEGDDITAELG